MKKIYLIIILLVTSINFSIAQKGQHNVDPVTKVVTNYNQKIQFYRICFTDLDTFVSYNHSNYNSIVGWEIDSNSSGRLFITSYNRNSQTKNILSIIECTKHQTDNGAFYLFILKNKYNADVSATLSVDKNNSVTEFMMWNSDRIASVFY